MALARRTPPPPGHLEREFREARHIFDRILEDGSPCVANARILTRAEDTLNGDLVICEEGDHGEQCFLVGDFAGHGLCAAIGTIIASQVFRAMVRKQLPLEQIARELDAKVGRLLPTGRFLAGAMIVYEPSTGALELWNASLPEILVWRAGEGVVARIGSSHPPLGILGPANDARPTRLQAAPEDRVLVVTDGLLEASGGDGQMLGNSWLLDLLSRQQRALSASEWLIDRVLARFGELGGSAADDMSLLELRTLPVSRISVDRTEPEDLAGWRFQLELGPEGLRSSARPLEPVTAALESLELGARDRSAVAMIVSELFSNALEHGVLRLDSSLKAVEDGLTRYFHARAAALARLHQGRIRVAVERRDETDLQIEVNHDGVGFDPDEVFSALHATDRKFGRGLELVRGLCVSLDHHDGGRAAIAIYRCSGERRPE